MIKNIVRLEPVDGTYVPKRVVHYFLFFMNKENFLNYIFIIVCTTGYRQVIVCIRGNGHFSPLMHNVSIFRK